MSVGDLSASSREVAIGVASSRMTWAVLMLHVGSEGMCGCQSKVCLDR
jgi:hypothetical protein